MNNPQFDPFQIIADPSRRKILELLSEEEMTVNSLVENFEMSRPAVSKHIKILQEGGFVSIRNQGRERICSLRHQGFLQIQEWLSNYEVFWANRLSRLQQLLSKNSD
ncbi:ArsR/SmtB family transcription factor [Algoriphagus sp. PAP.12]|uniref:ArsR/SmtB family transcription factor n=1 Tax=Algoriphagus sp. PAP.12 TaxID=2996678 RepID=UPI00227A9D99|nr:metalloregulator ArsR/SmtB family transcription factor [Algoriphagus sp. PAP.12]